MVSESLLTLGDHLLNRVPVTVLSGSSGNCVYVASGRTRVLVDAGASGKKIVQALEDIQVDAREIDAILEGDGGSFEAVAAAREVPLAA